MVIKMIIDIGEHEFTIIWQGVYYFALSDKSIISDWELHKLCAFVEYERKQGRGYELVCSNDVIKAAVLHAFSHRNLYADAPRPSKLTACTACAQMGCVTDFVCHTASVENAASILRGGSLMSAVKAREMPAALLALEKRNAAGDPPDYFDYIMFAWGNCPAGDRLIAERRLGHDPSPEELENAFTAGVRFYYRYDDLSRDKNAVDDGYHPLKIRDELVLDERIYAIILPESSRTALEPLIKPTLRDKARFIADENSGFNQWSKSVYEYIEKF